VKKALANPEPSTHGPKAEAPAAGGTGRAYWGRSAVPTK
jgi:hypothetical protein